MPAAKPLFFTERIGFSGHETFPFRTAWLKKAVDAVTVDPRVFTRDDAFVVLGVGKNMVRSIRHWALVTGVVAEDPAAADRGRTLRVSDLGHALFADDGWDPYLEDPAAADRGRTLRVSDLGRALFADDGWDPYLEDPASIWLIHAQLAHPASGATTWYYAFNEYVGLEFTRERLRDGIIRRFQPEAGRIHPPTVERDIDVFVRCYVPRRLDKVPVEDSFDCPLTELGLVRMLDDGRTFQFSVGPKPTLPVEVIGYALVRLMQRRAGRQGAIALDECLYEPLSPGQIFKLDENSLMMAIEALESLTGGAFVVDETAGLRQVYVRGDRDVLRAGALLEHYYARMTGS
jgi:hypothetical protein